MKRLFRTNEATQNPKPKDEFGHVSKAVKTDVDDSVLFPQKELLDDPDPTTAFQKNAIYRRMLEYRRLYLETLEKSQSLEDQKLHFDSSLKSFVDCLSLISKDLSIIRGLDDVDLDTRSLDAPLIQSILQSASISSTSNALDSCRSDIHKSIAKVAALVSGLDKRDPQLDKVQSRCRNLSAENTDLKSTASIQSQRIQDLLMELESLKSAKIASDRKFDRLRLSLDSNTNNLQQNGSSSSSLTQQPQQYQGLESAGSSTVSLDVNMVMDSDATNTANNNTAVDAPLKQELEILAESRLKEIEALTAQKLELTQQFELYKINNALQQGDQPMVHPSIVVELEGRLRIAQDLYMTNKKRADDLQLEVAEMKAEQRMYLDQVDNEEAAKRKVLENELKKMEADLARVRNHRDGLSEAAQLQKEKDAFDTHQQKEIMFLAGSQKSKIQELESKIERLKMKLVTNDTDAFLREFFYGKPKQEEGEAMNTDLEGNIFSELRKRLDASEAKANELEHLLRSFENASQETLEKQQLLFSENTVRLELEKVKEQLASLDPEASKTVAELEVKIDFYQKSEARLIQEIEMLSAAWTDLETQNQRKVFNLAEKEDQILKLISERTKFDQKCERLTKERNMINNQVIALKRQSERQLEQIRKLEERERGLIGQLQTLEKDLATKTVAADVHRKKVTELNQKQMELVDKLEKLQAKFIEAERVLSEKMKQLSDDSHAQKRLLEKIEVMKKKLDSQPKAAEMSDSYLQEENEGLKLLVKCSSCSNNFKSHILTKSAFKSLLDKITMSQQTIAQLASFALKKPHRPHATILFAVVRERISTTGTLNRLPLLYTLDAICQRKPKEWVKLVGASLVEIVNEIVPEKEPVNAAQVKKCIKAWKARGIFPMDILESLDTRMNELLAKAPAITPTERTFTTKEIMRRIEEDRDRHKKAREEGWYRPDPSADDSHNPQPPRSSSKRSTSSSRGGGPSIPVARDEFSEAWDKIPAPNLDGDLTWFVMKEDLDRFDATHVGYV
ncbi:UNVERIFIED_CONTAM: E3 ubiquitin-protein ligase BRE1A [Siphonaria sp. JEL0065]|nr:E3 ubiquitin-protein ligase BRE1A [Siphonaria sp. JEL0065]